MRPLALSAVHVAGEAGDQERAAVEHDELVLHGALPTE
jgi:hypothetical protein